MSGYRWTMTFLALVVARRPIPVALLGDVHDPIVRSAA